MYERYILMFAAEGPAPDEILAEVLRGFRNITLIPPFTKKIALISPVRFPIAVFNGKKNEDQPYLGVYRSDGFLSANEIEALRNSNQFTVDFVGSLECAGATLEVRGTSCSQQLAQGTMILVDYGDQQGPYHPTFGGNGPKLFEVSRDSGTPVFRSEYSTEAEANAVKQMLSEVLPHNGRALKFNDDPDAAAVADLIWNLSDDELRTLRKKPNATAAELDAFRKFIRRRCHE